MSGKTTYYQRNRQIILNRAKGYYKNHKERLRQQARNKYKDLFEKEKDIKREYGRNGYKICLKKNKQKSKSIPKNYCRANKNAFNKIKRPISINKIDIKTIVLSSEHSFGNKGLFKYFIGYTDR